MRWIAPAVILFFIPSLALADAIAPPREDCPPGSEDVFCHGPATCRPVACDTGCAEGTTCSQQRYCLQSNGCGGRSGTPVYDNALLACSSDDDCSESGTTCEAVDVCVENGCGCSAPGRGTRGSLAGSLFALVALLSFRRRGRLSSR